MQTSITLNELIKLCKDNGVSLDTPVVVSDMDEWTSGRSHSYMNLISVYVNILKVKTK